MGRHKELEEVIIHLLIFNSNVSKEVNAIIEEINDLFQNYSNRISEDYTKTALIVEQLDTSNDSLQARQQRILDKGYTMDGNQRVNPKRSHS